MPSGSRSLDIAEEDGASRAAKRPRTGSANRGPPLDVRCSIVHGQIEPEEAADALGEAAFGSPRPVRLCATIVGADADARRSSWERLVYALQEPSRVVELDLWVGAGPCPCGPVGPEEVAARLAPCRARAKRPLVVRFMDARDGRALLDALPRGIAATAAYSAGPLSIRVRVDRATALQPFDPPHTGVRSVTAWWTCPVGINVAAVRAFAESVPNVERLCVPGGLRAHCAALSRMFPRLRTLDAGAPMLDQTDDDGDCVLCHGFWPDEPGFEAHACDCYLRAEERERGEWNCVADAVAPGVELLVNGQPVPRGRRCTCEECTQARARAAVRAWLLVAARRGLPPPVAFVAAGFDLAVYCGFGERVAHHPLLLPNHVGAFDDADTGGSQVT